VSESNADQSSAKTMVTVALKDVKVTTTESEKRFDKSKLARPESKNNSFHSEKLLHFTRPEGLMRSLLHDNPDLQKGFTSGQSAGDARADPFSLAASQHPRSNQLSNFCFKLV
jgi:hypothetical protein